MSKSLRLYDLKSVLQSSNKVIALTDCYLLRSNDNLRGYIKRLIETKKKSTMLIFSANAIDEVPEMIRDRCVTICL